MFAFPAFKIGLLLLRQISKPVAKYVQNQAKSHPNFRRLAIRFAQGYHRLEIRMKRNQADAGDPPATTTITPLSDVRAIDLASSFIAETLVFSVAVLAVTVEAYRKRLDDREKAAEQEMARKVLEERLQWFEAELDRVRRFTSIPPPPAEPVPLEKPKAKSWWTRLLSKISD